MPIQPLFINSFQKGAEENSNLGVGTMLGVENYSVKGVARLTKDTTKTSGSVVTDLPIFFTSHTAQDIFAQGDTGKTYRSIDTGVTWTDITDAAITPAAGRGRGLIFYQGFLFAFFNGAIYYCVSPFAAANWAAWSGKTGLSGTYNFPFLFPNDNSVYFANGNKVGKIGFGTASTFNPAGSSGTDYFYSASQLTLPDIYEVTCMSYLPSNFIALGTASSGIGNSSQIADIILWNPTLSTYETPLPLYSQAGLGVAGVKQIINRNNVLYAVTGGNHAIFSTNGTSFTLVDDVSLMMTSRLETGTGVQSTAPLFVNQYPQGIAILGNKLYTGTSTSISSQPSGYGLFPLGVWSVAFTEGGHATQCEFPISTGTVIAHSSFFIGSVYPVTQNQLLIGWQDGSAHGIDKSEFTSFQTDSSVVQIESQMMEIGTPLEPAVITTIQINLVRSLIAGQSISISYRSAFDQPYTPVPTGSFTSTTGNVQNNNSLKCTITNIGTVKFLQLRIEMATGSPNQAWTPEIRNIIVK